LAPREFHETIASTQGRAVELARAGAPVGTRVRAVQQSAGRGRGDHRWESPAGGLWLSVVLPASPGDGALLPLAVGERLLEALVARYALPLRLKWPNDLLVVGSPGRPRKLAGILVDQVPSPSLGAAAVVGIGVNVRVDPGRLSPELRGSVASLHEFVDPAPSVDEVEELGAASALGAGDWLRSSGGPAQVVDACRRNLYGIGRRARVDGRMEGTISGLAADGALLLERGTDRVSIRAGDLRVEESA